MWETSIALRHGLTVAVDECIAIGPAVIFAKACALAVRVREGLAKIEGCVLRDAPPSFDGAFAATLGVARGAIVTFEAESTLHIPAAHIAKALGARCIAVSVSLSTHSFNESHWGPPVVRISPHHFNKAVDVDMALEVIRETLSLSLGGQNES